MSKSSTCTDDSGIALNSPVNVSKHSWEPPGSPVESRTTSIPVPLLRNNSHNLLQDLERPSLKPMSRSAPSAVTYTEKRSHNLRLDPSPDPGASEDEGTGWGSWGSSSSKQKLDRAHSFGHRSVASFGKGFDWRQGVLVNSIGIANGQPDSSNDETMDVADDWGLPPHLKRKLGLLNGSNGSEPQTNKAQEPPVISVDTSPRRQPLAKDTIVSSPMATSPQDSPAPSRPISPSVAPTRIPLSRSSTNSLQPRRRPSAKRVSLIAGRISIIATDPPSPPPITSPVSHTPKLSRFGSASSFLSVVSTAAPPPDELEENFLGNKNIDDFVIDEEIGRGAYGLVKKGREILANGALGPPVIIKMVIKQRILADCWKKHPQYGTIPIEIYVMSAISSASLVLPARRPWDPARFEGLSEWEEGKVVQGHPNICPLLDFFEDHHYYYLVLPYTIPSPDPLNPTLPVPKDLFDLVEVFPHGLPPKLIRSYLGQIADGLCFLHSKGIVHRDIKDENVVLGPEPGKCILIDFGSSGIVRKNGWDTFSGTLDYAGPEILRGERYSGKEQDVWAFGVVAYVLIVGECPFATPAEAQEGLNSSQSKASLALEERCGAEHKREGEEVDEGGMLGDAADLVRECLHVEVASRPTVERILESRFLIGKGGWFVER